MTKKIALKDISELAQVKNPKAVISIQTSNWFTQIESTYNKQLAACTNLEVLHFYRGVYFAKIPTSVLGLEKLQHLVFNSCGLNSISPSIARLENLKTLILNGLYLNEFPSAIGYLSQLEELDFYNTKLKTDLEDFENLKQLRHLNLMRTNLKKLSKKILLLPQLQELFVPKPIYNWLLKEHPDFIAKIPYVFQHHALERKHLISLLHIARKHSYSWHRRAVFMNLLGDNHQKLATLASLNDILAATEVPTIEVLRLKAFEYYEKHWGKSHRNSFGATSHFTVVGTLKIKKKALRQKLKELGIQYSATLSNKTTHLLLGQNSKGAYQKALEQNIPIITEQMVLDFTNEHTKQYLVDDKEARPTYTNNLSNLLLSGQEENIALALQLFEQGGFSVDLLTELFIAYKHTRDSAIQAQAAQFLRQYGSVGLIDIAKKRSALFPDYGIESTLTKTLLQLEKTTELDTLKIAWYGFKKYKRGLHFLLKRLPYDEKLALLKDLSKDNTLNLSLLGLTSIPPEVFELPHLTSLNLSYNNISSISLKLLPNLAQLEHLYLKNNWQLWDKKNVFNRYGELAKNKKDQQAVLVEKLTEILPNLNVIFY